WAGVAAAGVGGGIINAVQANPGALGLGGVGKIGMLFVSGMAGDIASSATRSLVNGSDFGDNIIAGLPDVVGQTIGNLLVGAVTKSDGIEPVIVTPRQQLGSLLDPNNGECTSGQVASDIPSLRGSISDTPELRGSISDDSSTDGQIETVVVTAN